MRVDHVLLGGREELDVPPSHVRTVLRLKRVRGILLISKSYVPVARGASLAVEAEQRSSQGNLKVAEKLGNRLLCRLIWQSSHAQHARWRQRLNRCKVVRRRHARHDPHRRDDGRSVGSCEVHRHQGAVRWPLRQHAWYHSVRHLASRHPGYGSHALRVHSRSHGQSTHVWRSRHLQRFHGGRERLDGVDDAWCPHRDAGGWHVSLDNNSRRVCRSHGDSVRIHDVLKDAQLVFLMIFQTPSS
mmetsp:Transcript_2031/g.4592  ORF Transcript_2031/g.4592 Transcript_2031/m.4592 type:complete len:243 (+) Transcript_2031:258-986(+)